jgi:hypothetical protein
MRLYIDDIRPVPAGFDIVARDFQSAIDALKTGNITHVSFDHDLGTEESGYNIACWVEGGAAAGTLPRMTWAVHSANPPGAERIRMAMTSAERFWNAACQD